MASGAAGGAFGLATLPIELPVSTIIMLRSIAAIARNEGEDPSHPETALSCIQVFALGGRTDSADPSESGYFAVRALLAKSVTEAARFIAERGIIEEGAPVLVRFTTLVASRFGVVLSQKFAAQALPVVGALGGASVNYVFIEHFQEIAQGHFTVRRLEESMEKISYGRNMSASLRPLSPGDIGPDARVPWRALRRIERRCSAAGAGAAAYACPDGPPRDVESGGLPLAVANLEVAYSAGIRGNRCLWSGFSRRCGQNIPSTVSTSG